MNSNLQDVKMGFVGLGKMGRGLASTLGKAGYEIMVYGRSEDARRAVAADCKVADSMAEVFAYCEVLMLSLPGSAEVEEVVGNFLQSGVTGKVLIDFTTSYPDSTRELCRQMTAAGGNMLDAPLSGGPAQAASGKSTVIVGGDAALFERCKEIFDTIGQTIIYVGESGAGNTAKLASNYVSILSVAMYAEIIPLVEKLGLDPEKFYEVVSGAGGNSPIFRRSGRMMVDDKYEALFDVDMAFKDLGYIKSLFDSRDAFCGILDSGMNLFKMARCAGFGEGDMSEVCRVTRGLLKQQADSNDRAAK